MRPAGDRAFDDADADELLAVFQDPAVRPYLLDDEGVPVEWVMAEIASSRGAVCQRGHQPVGHPAPRPAARGVGIAVRRCNR